MKRAAKVCLAKDFSLKDFEVNSLVLTSYVTMRLAVLGGCLAILGTLFSTRPEDLLVPTAKPAVMLIVVLAAIRVIAAINRNIFARCLYLALVERDLGQVGFYSCWRFFVERRGMDTTGHAFVIACRTINWGISFYGVAYAIAAYTDDVLTMVSGGWFIFAAIVAGIANEVFIKKQLSTQGFLKEMVVDIERSRLSAAGQLTQRNVLSSKATNLPTYP